MLLTFSLHTSGVGNDCFGYKGVETKQQPTCPFLIYEFGEEEGAEGRV